MDGRTLEQRVLSKLDLDLINCSEEEIHRPQAIQSHGYLLVVSKDCNKIIQVSKNLSNFFEMDLEEIFKQNPSQLLNIDIKKLAFDKDIGSPFFHYYQKIELRRKTLKLIIHRNTQGYFVIEFEPIENKNNSTIENIYYEIINSLNNLNKAEDLNLLYQYLTDEIKRITNMDRVLLYKFLPDGSGEVISESLNDGMEAYLGLRYPASDIPEQARRLYVRNNIRLIVDANSSQVEIISDDIEFEPVDLTFSSLRSVSPVHLEYLKNMGVTASMSISIVKDNALWGLIACHHQQPYFVDYRDRVALELISKVVESEIFKRESEAIYRLETEQRKSLNTYIHEMNQAEDFNNFLLSSDSIMKVFDCSGVIVYRDDNLSHFGKTPDYKNCLELIEWLGSNFTAQVWQTNDLSSYNKEFEKFSSLCSGILVLKLFDDKNDFIVWLRPEVVQIIKWAGDPYELKQDSDGKIHPRNSFKVWTEENKNKSIEWGHSTVDICSELKDNLVKFALSDELKKSNRELDYFTSIVSHDLKEPIRNIGTYSDLLKDEIASKEAKELLDKINQNADQFQKMITELRDYSTISKIDLAFEKVDLNKVVKRLLESLSQTIKENNVEILFKENLPTVRCDAVRISHVFFNLISNGIKYNDKANKIIEIGYEVQEHENLTFFVRDNGIGLSEHSVQDVYRIFRRLPNKLDTSGTGIGLTIAKRIIERHGGIIWFESNIGEGSTFYFRV